MKPKLLVITPLMHIEGVSNKLDSFTDVTYLDDPTLDELIPIINQYEAIYTNPNK